MQLPPEYLTNQSLKDDVSRLGIDANQELTEVYVNLHVLHESTTKQEDCDYIRSVMFRVATQPVTLPITQPAL